MVRKDPRIRHGSSGPDNPVRPVNWTGTWPTSAFLDQVRPGPKFLKILGPKPIKTGDKIRISWPTLKFLVRKLASYYLKYFVFC